MTFVGGSEPQGKWARRLASQHARYLIHRQLTLRLAAEAEVGKLEPGLRLFPAGDVGDAATPSQHVAVIAELDRHHEKKLDMHRVHRQQHRRQLDIVNFRAGVGLGGNRRVRVAFPGEEAGKQPGCFFLSRRARL